MAVKSSIKRLTMSYIIGDGSCGEIKDALPAHNNPPLGHCWRN